MHAAPAVPHAGAARHIPAASQQPDAHVVGPQPSGVSIDGVSGCTTLASGVDETLPQPITKNETNTHFRIIRSA
jgi:hypothetical protein